MIELSGAKSCHHALEVVGHVGSGKQPLVEFTLHDLGKLGPVPAHHLHADKFNRLMLSNPHAGIALPGASGAMTHRG